MAQFRVLDKERWIRLWAAGVLIAALGGCGGGSDFSPATAPPGGDPAPVSDAIAVTLAADADEIGFGNTVAVHASVTSANGAPLTYTWTGVAAPATGKDATVKTPDLATVLAGKAAPANDPGGYYGLYKQEDRFGILPINPDNKGPVTATVVASACRSSSFVAADAQGAGVACLPCGTTASRRLRFFNGNDTIRQGRG